MGVDWCKRAENCPNHAKNGPERTGFYSFGHAKTGRRPQQASDERYSLMRLKQAPDGHGGFAQLNLPLAVASGCRETGERLSMAGTNAGGIQAGKDKCHWLLSFGRASAALCKETPAAGTAHETAVSYGGTWYKNHPGWYVNTDSTLPAAVSAFSRPAKSCGARCPTFAAKFRQAKAQRHIPSASSDGFLALHFGRFCPTTPRRSYSSQNHIHPHPTIQPRPT